MFSHQSPTPLPKIYLIPGQGADARMFKNLKIDSSFKVHYLKWIRPEKEDKMADLAKKMAIQIDTSEPFILVGVSLGGMMVTEMCDFLNPEKAIIISSAKCRAELPQRYKILHHMPLNRLMPGFFYKYGAMIAQPIVEPDRKKEKATCQAMLRDNDPVFLKRSTNMIINWERQTYSDQIVHIHGEKDHTLPIKHIKYDHFIKGGSHMMTLTRGDEISGLLNGLLLKG